MSRVLSSFLIVILAIFLLSNNNNNKRHVVLAQGTPAPATPQCTSGCQPWNPSTACAIGGTMRLPFVLDISKENAQDTFPSGNQNQIGFGFCPQVDQLQAFSLQNAAGWAAGNFKSGNFTADAGVTDGSAVPAYLRIFGAVGFQDTKTNIPRNSYSSSAVIFDPKASCRTATGEDGFLITNFLVINFTMTNGEYRMLSSFDQSVQVGFQPTCDFTDTCAISPDQPCLGNATGFKNCATCVPTSGGVEALDETQIQVFASYYGTDSNGRKMQSGSSNPLNFLALSSTGVFNKLKSDITSAANTVKNQVPGQS